MYTKGLKVSYTYDGVTIEGSICCKHPSDRNLVGFKSRITKSSICCCYVNKYRLQFDTPNEFTDSKRLSTKSLDDCLIDLGCKRILTYEELLGTRV